MSDRFLLQEETTSAGDSHRPNDEFPAGEPSSHRMVIFLLVHGPIARTDIPALCERAGAVLDRCDVDPACDVRALSDPDAVAVDALARVQLRARRAGRRVRLQAASGDLQDLLAFMGLSEVLPCDSESGVEPGREVE
jgi:ABC-type transporter Mla MlaB component